MILAIRDRMGKRDEGFTLIELLVVVIIIGILAAIAIPVFLNQRQRGWQAAVTSDVRNAAIEVESVYTAEGAYPTTLPATGTSSNDTVLGYARTAEGFCIIGQRPDLDPGAAIYQSLQGGTQPFNTTMAYSATPTCTVTP